MKTKKKISVTIDEGLFEAVDQASRRFQVARSQLAQEAFTLWLRNKTESLMAQGYREMAREDEEKAERSLAAQTVKTSQILTVSKERLEKKLGAITAEKMQEVNQALRLSFAL